MYEIYQIEYGDTIDSIAEKSGTTVDKLREINKTITVVPGAGIIVPVMNDQLFEMYTVKKGDSPYVIAQKYGVSLSDLLSLNGLEKNDYIYPGQQLVVPNQEMSVYITQQGDNIEELISNFQTIDSIKEGSKLALFFF